jgi:hypothetical protein
MKRGEYLTDRPMDWQDKVVIKACLFTAIAFAWFVFMRWI